ncbi:hypothetical protein [Actinoplanes sp. URMC 104]|uniref:hypothetical protein n=1 Tax=Actinoplanes sp. URMC 104 TaxID=3423409 RepID=UPI003F1A6DB8
MSRQVRQRVTAIVLGGLIFGAPMLANGTASADPIGGDGARQVTFVGGGMFGLSCRSRPSVESLTVPAKSTIRVVNETGYAADLLLGGKAEGTLAEGASTEVIFRRGTTAVTLEPDCTLGDEPTPVMVTASPSAPATTATEPAPEPTATDEEEPMSLPPTRSGDSDGPPSVLSAPGAAPAERPSRAKPAGSRPDPDHRTLPRHDTVAPAVQTMPHGGAAPQPKVKTSTAAGTPGAATPAFSGMPPGSEPTLLPGVPALEPEPVTVGSEPATPTPPPTDIAAAEPVAALEPMQDEGPRGLLALIAAVCVVGVSVGAIRSIVSQRANRAGIA